MATTADIRNDAAEKLGILAEGEQLGADASTDLDNAYLEVHDELERDGLIWWTNTANIPDAYVAPIVSLVAVSRAVTYKVPIDRFQQLQVDELKAWRKIWKLSAKPAISRTEIANF